MDGGFVEIYDVYILFLFLHMSDQYIQSMILHFSEIANHSILELSFHLIAFIFIANNMVCLDLESRGHCHMTDCKNVSSIHVIALFMQRKRLFSRTFKTQ